MLNHNCQGLKKIIFALQEETINPCSGSHEDLWLQLLLSKDGGLMLQPKALNKS